MGWTSQSMARSPFSIRVSLPHLPHPGREAPGVEPPAASQSGAAALIVPVPMHGATVPRPIPGEETMPSKEGFRPIARRELLQLLGLGAAGAAWLPAGRAYAQARRETL